MTFKPALVAFTSTAAAAAALAGAPATAADTGVQYLGQPGELVNGSVVQHWTVTDLKPSTDVIPYRSASTLWEATATDEAVAGNATPIVSNLNARAENGDTHRVLFGLATEQGVNPSTLAQGQKATGKIYFDVTGEAPDSVFYSSGGPEELLWVAAPPPAPAVGSTGESGSSSYTNPAPSSGSAVTATPATSGATPAATPPSVTPTPAAAPAGSAGTPLPAGSAGTPVPVAGAPASSAGTPEAGASAPADASPAPIPPAVAPAPQGSSGTPLPQGAAPVPASAAGTPAQPAPAPGAPTTTVVVPPVPTA